MIQLSLFPARGFGLLVFGSLLTGPDGLPAVETTRRRARARARASAKGESAWWRESFSVVRVEVHPPAAPDWNPTYIIL